MHYVNDSIILSGGIFVIINNFFGFGIIMEAEGARTLLQRREARLGLEKAGKVCS
jgi:hypothetical protein